MAATGCVLVTGSAAVSFAWFRKKPTSAANADPDSYTIAGDPVYLYDGQSTVGWLPIVGGIRIDRDGEGANVLSVSGQVRRPIPNPPKNTSMTLGIDLADAETTDVTLAAENANSGLQLILRLTKSQGATLGTQRDREPFQPIGSSIPLPKQDKFQQPYLEVQAKHLGGQWLVQFDGKLMQPISAPVKLNPEIRIQCDGTIRLDSARIEELTRK